MKEYINYIKDICRNDSHASYLDKDNILWRYVNDEWIGKPAHQTVELKWQWI